MSIILILIVVVVLILLIEWKLFKTEGLIKEKILYIILLLVGISFNIILAFNIEFPYLLDWLEIVYGTISDKWYA